MVSGWRAEAGSGPLPRYPQVSFGNRRTVLEAGRDSARPTLEKTKSPRTSPPWPRPAPTAPGLGPAPPPA